MSVASDTRTALAGGAASARRGIGLMTSVLIAGMAGLLDMTGWDGDGFEQHARQRVQYGQEATVLSIITVAAVAVVGTLIIGEIDSALPDPANSSLDNASGELIVGVGDAMGLLPVVFIVLVAALVIGVVRNFR